MKTAISIPNDLFQEIEKTAKKQKRSRSDIFAVATREYLDRIKSRAILDSLNEVYSEDESAEDNKRKKQAIQHFRKHVAKEPY